MFNFLKKLLDVTDNFSTTNFSLVMSVLIGILLNLTVCICLLYDIFHNGIIDTDLDKLGWFILSTGGYIMGSASAKIFKRRGQNNATKTEENAEGSV